MEMNYYPKVAIVALNYNGSENTIRCLESLYQMYYKNYYVVLVDNGSKDDPLTNIIKWVETRIPIPKIVFVNKKDESVENYPSEKRLIIIENERNLGNAGGKNVGSRYALDILKVDYIVLLDNDTIVYPNFLDELVRVALEHPDAGIFGTKILHSFTDEIWYGGGLINYWTGRMPQRGAKLEELEKGKTAVNVDWAATCCAMVSSKMCHNIGLLDEDFAFGFEEVEIGIRATRNGYKVLYVPNAIIRHCPTYKDEDNKRRKRLYYTLAKGQFILMQKYWSKPQFISTTLYYFAYNLAYLIHFLIYSRDWDAIRLRLRGLWDFVRERKQYKQSKPLP